MNKRVNFEDNIFILLMRLRVIKDIITLDADPELFLEKILDDIYFTDQILKILFEYLKENTRLICRDEFLEHFSEAEWQFSQIIGGILNNEGNISVQDIPSIHQKLILLRSDSQERQKAAESLLPGISGKTDCPVVSSDEISELLKAF